MIVIYTILLISIGNLQYIYRTNFRNRYISFFFLFSICLNFLLSSVIKHFFMSSRQTRYNEALLYYWILVFKFVCKLNLFTKYESSEVVTTFEKQWLLKRTYIGVVVNSIFDKTVAALNKQKVVFFNPCLLFKMLSYYICLYI